MSDTPLKRLRATYSLADLPGTITAGAPGAAISKPIEQATVDDLAFALQRLNDNRLRCTAAAPHCAACTTVPAAPARPARRWQSMLR